MSDRRLAETPALQEPFTTALRWTITVSLVLIPLAFQAPAYDSFRYTKFILFRATALAILGIFATAAIFGKVDIRRLVSKRPVLVLLAAILLWSVATTLLSSNKPVSYRTFEHTIEAMIFFIGAWNVVDELSLERLLAIPFATAMINAVLAALQAMNVWNPFPFPKRVPIHLRTVALLGNPNDVGAYLLPVAIMALVLAVIRKNWRWVAVAVVLIAGIGASETLTAIAGTVTGVLVLVLLISRRAGWRTVAFIVVALFLAFALLPPARERVRRFTEAVRNHDLAAVTSGRVYPATAAWDMFLDRPITGMGPGTFKYHYLEYRMKQSERDPSLFALGSQNFAETHSDHLQVLAEEGIPGWLLFIAFFVLLAMTTVRQRKQHGEERQKFVYFAGAPLAAALCTLAIAAFPMELVAVLQVILYFSAAILKWSDG